MIIAGVACEFLETTDLAAASAKRS